MDAGGEHSSGGSQAETVGLVGAGLLGQAIAARLLGAGYAVTGWDTSGTAREALAEMGGTIATDSAAAFGCRRIMLSLPDDEAVAEVLAESGEALPDGATLIDTTTGDPFRQAATGQRLAERGVAYLDATVGGSSQHVREGTAVVMAGGDPLAFADCEDLLATFASRVFHVGACGSGSRMKLVVNLVLGLNRAALAEGLALANGFDLDPQLVLECLLAGPARSQAMDDKGQKMIEGRFDPQARLSQHLKDVRLIVEAGRNLDVPLPLSQLHEGLLAAVEAAGFGGDDNSAVIRAWGVHGDEPPAGR